MNGKEKIVEFMTEQSYKPMVKKELAKIFEIKKDEMKTFDKLLEIMESEALIVKTSGDRYGIPSRLGFVVGKLQGNAKGFGFVLPDEDRPDVFIPANSFNGAMHNDRVISRIVKEEGDSRKCEGEILRVIEHGNKTVIGIFQSNENFGFVLPEDKRINTDIFIPKGDRSKAKNGQIVIAEIIEWPSDKRKPEGRIIEVLGNKGEKGIDILTIIKKHNLPEEFPEKVQRYTEGITDVITESEIQGREDFRGDKIVTIDGEDAKDLDDAVSLKLLDNGNFELAVHIADVSHYVKDRSPLDKEALNRGTSVYLIDRVIPMLPKRLSNGICSLNPAIDRLTLSCIMEIDRTGKVIDHRLCKSIIKTSERMTYTDVTGILREKDEALIKRYSYLHEDFKLMEELCHILRGKRMKRGAVDFDFVECKIILDESGKPVEIKPYERAIANKIIEEFMLVCNETVAEHMFWANMPFVYRIHEEPKTDKLEHFNEFVHNLGYTVHFGKEVHPKALQEIIEKVKGKKEEMVVSTLLLRSMMQAKYSPECTGHFGLAAKYYCHFTSPIRRYPDLIIHRIIKEYIGGAITERRMAKLTSDVEYAAKQSSEMERFAQQAEIEVDDLKKAEYMSFRIGEEFDGIISSVTSFGFFVGLPNTVEGLVHVNSLDDDYYVFDEKYLTLIGERKKKTYKLGDEIKVKLERVDLDSYEIYFQVVKTEPKKAKEEQN